MVAQYALMLTAPARQPPSAAKQCLDKLRRHPAIAALINAETQTA